MRTKQQVKDEIVALVTANQFVDYSWKMNGLISELNSLQEPKELLPPKQHLTDRVSYHWIKMPQFRHYVPVRWRNEDRTWRTYGSSYSPKSAYENKWEYVKECLP